MIFSFAKQAIYNNKHDIKKLRDYGVKLLAEKVETLEESEIASESGFDYFQGNFYSEAEIVIMENKAIPDRTMSLQSLPQLPN